MKNILIIVLVIFPAKLLLAQNPPTGENTKEYEVVVPTTEEKVIVDEVFDVVEEQPQFPGGTEELYKFIISNFKIDSTLATPINGKIYVGFVVDKDGTITQPKIMRGMQQESLNKEALRVVSIMPKWIPGKQGGKEVKVRYYLPILVKKEK